MCGAYDATHDAYRVDWTPPHAPRIDAPDRPVATQNFSVVHAQGDGRVWHVWWVRPLACPSHWTWNWTSAHTACRWACAPPPPPRPYASNLDVLVWVLLGLLGLCMGAVSHRHCTRPQVTCRRRVPSHYTSL